MLKQQRRIKIMTKPTNVVMLDFQDAKAMEEFIEMYERDASELY
jgi:hypothetical protein